jgi:CheY-like chemotaxis protein
MTGKQILIVEDEKPIRDMIAFGLRRAGFDVREAEDCTAARARIADRRPDLLLVDWMLPDQSGLELTRLLKGDPRTRHVAVLAVTGPSRPGTEERVLAAGCDGYIPKPIDTQRLTSQIADLLSRTPVVPPEKREHLRVLIVDDNPTNRQRLRSTLEAEGHRTIEAGDGLEALEKLRSSDVDAVISDVLMPRMDGYRFSYEVRRSEELRDIPIVTASGKKELH